MKSRVLDAIRVALRRAPNRLEAKLLMHLAGAFSGLASDILKTQLAAVNLVQRHSHGREVNFYHIERGKPAWGKVVSFPRRDLELKLASITVSYGKGREERLKADIWCVKGRVFSMVFDQSPRSALNSSATEVLKVVLHKDPMVPQEDESQQEPPRTEREPVLFGWLLEWQEKHGISDLRAPRHENKLRSRIEELGVAFPEEYLCILKQTDGLTVGETSVFSLKDVFEITMPDGDYCLIAEVAPGRKQQGYLGVRSDSVEGHVFYLVHDGRCAVDLGKSFREAVEKFLEDQERRDL